MIIPKSQATGQVKIYQADGPGQQQLLLRSAGYEKLGLKFTLTVAEDMQSLAADIQYFQNFSLLLLAMTGITIVLIQRYVLRRGFRALDRVRHEVHQVSSGKIQQLQDMGPDEIRPLSIEINRLLTQLQHRLRRSRDALGNLAHALKGPISLMMHDIDRLPLSSAEKANLTNRLDRISSLIERELKRARFAGDDVGQHFLPSSDIADLIGALQLIYLDKNLKITTGKMPTTTLPLDREDMLELLGNLLDNACKWANSKVALQLTINNQLLIQVEDDGPGVKEKDRAIMQQRGMRMDEQEAGYGLGLAIVNDLIADLQGNIEFAHSTTLGGLLVSVSIPLPKP
jgi:signal transduction histidine kinase